MRTTMIELDPWRFLLTWAGQLCVCGIEDGKASVYGPVEHYDGEKQIVFAQGLKIYLRNHADRSILFNDKGQIRFSPNDEEINGKSS